MDLRWNPGGLADEANNILDMLLDEEKLYGDLANGETVPTWVSQNSTQKITDVPIVVLVNGASVSAAELVAGPLQAHGRGVVVGSPTYGKGTILGMIDLRHEEAVNAISQILGMPQDMDYSFPGILIVTERVYYFPNGKTSQKVGVIPDIEVLDPAWPIYQEFYKHYEGETFFTEREHWNAIDARPISVNFSTNPNHIQEINQIKTHLNTQMRSYTAFEQKDIQLAKATDVLSLLTAQAIQPKMIDVLTLYDTPNLRLHFEVDPKHFETRKGMLWVSVLKPVQKGMWWWAETKWKPLFVSGLDVSQEHSFTLDLSSTEVQKYIQKNPSETLQVLFTFSDHETQKNEIVLKTAVSLPQ